MEWKIDICGVYNVGGKKFVYDLQIKWIEFIYFIVLCRYYIYSMFVVYGVVCFEINEEYVYRLNIL